MIVSIEIENFKGIGKRQCVNLAPINLFFGANSAGKSTLLHAILYFHSIMVEGRTEPSCSSLGGMDFDLGGFSQAVFGQDPDREISIKLELAVDWEGVGRNNEILFDAREQSNEEFLGDNPTIGLETVLKMGRNNTEIVRFRFFLNKRPIITVELDRPTKAIRYQHAFGGVFWERNSPYQAGTAATGQEIYGVRLGTLNLHVSNMLKDKRIHDINKLATYRVQVPAGPPRPFFFTQWLGNIKEKNKNSDVDENEIHVCGKWMNGILFEFIGQLERIVYLGPKREQPNLLGEIGPTISLQDLSSGRAAWQILHYLTNEQISEVNYWLGEREIATGLQVVKGSWRYGWENDYRELTRVHFASERESDRPDVSRWFILRPQDIGVGISHVLPIIVHCVASSTGRLYERSQVLMIEQPELHLHPKAQTRLGDLFISKSGRDNDGRLQTQFFLETHSEHLILRLLRRIRETTRGTVPDDLAITPDEVNVCYVGRSQNGTEFRKIDISNDGRFIQPWPDDFFDLDFQERFA